MNNAANRNSDICPATRSFGRFLYLDCEGHSVFIINGTTYTGQTGIAYQLETHYIGGRSVATGTKPSFWFMARDKRGNIKDLLSSKFDTYDEAADHWFKMQQAAHGKAVVA